MISDTPFPMPYSVMISPIQVSTIVPATSVARISAKTIGLGLMIAFRFRIRSTCDGPWITASSTARYRVHCPILRRPASPSSRWISFRRGNTTSSRLKMIDAVMYGNTPSANTANRDSAPPTNRSMKPRALPGWLNRFCSWATSTPGTGMCDPMRNTASIPTVNRNFRRRSGIRKMLARPGIMRSPRPALPRPRSACAPRR